MLNVIFNMPNIVPKHGSEIDTFDLLKEAFNSKWPFFEGQKARDESYSPEYSRTP